MAQGPSSASSHEVAETSPAGSTEGGPCSSPSRRPVAAAATTTAQSPSSESTAYTLPATKPPPRPKRTYGKAPTAAAPASIAPAAPPRPTLKETTSIVIPETDPNAPPASEPASVHSPEDRVKKPVLAASSSSQTPASQHTTDPTSEEDVGSRLERPARRFPGVTEDADSGDSSSDDAEVDVEMASFLANRVTRDDLDAVDELEPAAVPSAAEKPQLVKSSSLPPLTPSTEDASQAVDASGEATPVRPSHGQQRAQDAPPSVEVGPTSPQAAPSPPPRRRRRAIESDESDDEVVHEKKAAPARKPAQEQLPTPAATAAPHGSKKERLKLLAEKRRQEQSESRRGKSAMAEEPEAAAADQDDEVEAEPDDVVDEVDAIMNEASTAKKGRNGLISRKRKSKGLTKKEQEEMERTAAAHARKVDVHLAATSRPALSVTDVFKKRPLAARPPSPVRYVGRASTPQAARPIIDLLATSSSDSIENPDIDPASTPPPYALKNVAASSKRTPRSDDIDDTPMPLRVHPSSFRPIGKFVKPEPAKKAAEPIAAVADDEEEGLEEFDLGAELVRSREQQERARKEQEKEEKRRALAERKQAAIRASRSNAPIARATEDPDSDLDIEGAPSTKKSVRHSRRSRSPSVAADTLAAYANRKQSSPKRTALLDGVLRFARASSEHPHSDDFEPSESQFKAAGKTFGANLDPNKRYMAGPKNRRQQAPVTVTQDINNEHLQRMMKEQNAKIRAKKQRNYRQMEQTGENGQKELQSVNVDAMVKAKKEREEEDEKMEEEDDGDYVDDEGEEEYNSADIGSDGDDEDDVGSESDAPVAHGRVPTPAPQNLDDDDLFDSEGEPVLPKSSQNDDRLGKAPDARDAFSDAEDEDDDNMLPPAVSRKARKAARIVDDEEEAQEEEAQEQEDFATVPAALVGSLEGVTPKKTRVELGGLLGDVGGDDGGFSQFFNSQFSPGGDGESVGGFLRRDDEVFEPPAPTMFAVQPLISTAERAKDAARLQARGGFNDLAPATPRELAAPRQYINEKGLLTQTRPAANFDSPSDTPLRSHRQTYSTLDSQSQAMEETQLASAQTPTQITQRATASQRPNALRRTEALSNLESVAEVAATEVVATMDGPETQVEETQPDADTQDESQDIRPSAAQVPAPGTPANAFEMLRAGAAREAEPEVTRPPKGRGGNAFIDTEANLSDEEGDRVFGGVSDDENEDDHDQELAELVDNTKEDEEVEAEQDEEAARLHREKEAEAEKAALARAQRVVDGKERNKRGRNELSDDDFDDDYARADRREKRARVVVATVADLKANDETRGFGDVLEKACVAETNETTWLNETQEESASEDDEMDDPRSDVFGSRTERINAYDVRAQVINLQRERDDAGESAEDAEDAESMLEERLSVLSPPLPGFTTSSPSRDFEINDRLIAAAVGKKKRVDHIDSQSLYSSTTAEVQYSAVGGDESQSMSAAVTSSRSAITSFKRTEKSKSQAAIGGTSNSAKAKGTPLTAKPSRLGNWRKRDAA